MNGLLGDLTGAGEDGAQPGPRVMNFYNLDSAEFVANHLIAGKG